MTARRTRRTSVAAMAGLTLFALSACGDDGGSDGAGDTAGGGGGGFEPSSTVEMLVPFAAGGGSDIAGRATAAGFEDAADVTISVRNVDGGSGAVGYAELLGAEGNENMLFSTETALIALAATQDVPFTYESFTPIMMLGEDYTLIVVREDSEMQTCNDLVERAESERTLVGISGVTGLDNIVFSLMEDETGVSFDRVPFESGGELLTAILGEQVQAISVNPGEVSGQLEAGELRALCAASEEPYEYDMLADVETAKEQGIDVAFAQFRGVLAPGGISEEARDYWIGIGQEYAESDAYNEYIESNMLQPNAAFGDDFTEVLARNDQLLREALDDN